VERVKYKLLPPYFPVFLLQPIRSPGFATLNTTLFIVNTLRSRSFAFGLGWEFAFGRGSFWPSGISFGGSRAFITGESFFGGSPGLLLQVKFRDG